MSDKPDDTIERIARVLCLHPDPDTMVPGMVVTKMDGGFAAAFNGPLEPAWHSHRDVAQKVVAAMSAGKGRQMSEWQDISTAPKDGTWILVYEPADYEPTVHVVHWGQPEWRGGDLTWVTVALGPNPDTYEPDATHWMPLPTPPSPPTQKDTK